MVKIADFGLARRISGPIYTVCGTPTYVAPEILTEKGYGVEVTILFISNKFPLVTGASLMINCL